MATRNGRGFTLAEVLLAIGTMVLVILTILALVISLNRGSRKSVDVAAAHLVADQVISTIVERAQKEVGYHFIFWTNPTIPQVSGSVISNRTEFFYDLDATTCLDAGSGLELNESAGVPMNRLKLVSVEVHWWNPAPSPAQQRIGYGKLSVRAVRLVNEERI